MTRPSLPRHSGMPTFLPLSHSWDTIIFFDRGGGVPRLMRATIIDFSGLFQSDINRISVPKCSTSAIPSQFYQPNIHLHRLRVRVLVVSDRITYPSLYGPTPTPLPHLPTHTNTQHPRNAVQLDRKSFLRKFTDFVVESACDHATCGGLLRRNSIMWRRHACLGGCFS